ncbi:MAG: hypothetical protein R6V26_02760 [Roseovarius sp.]
MALFVGFNPINLGRYHYAFGTHRGFGHVSRFVRNQLCLLCGLGLGDVIILGLGMCRKAGYTCDCRRQKKFVESHVLPPFLQDHPCGFQLKRLTCAAHTFTILDEYIVHMAGGRGLIKTGVWKNPHDKKTLFFQHLAPG